MRNIPVAIRTGGTIDLYVFPDFTVAGDCTARTTKGRRCGNVAWDQGQVSSYETFFVDDCAVAVLGVLPDEAGRRYLTQRCRVHDSPDVAAYCDPGWERFDPRRHHEMTHRPHVLEMFSHYGGVPPIPALAAALREHFTPTELRQLAGQLAESTGDAADHADVGSSPPWGRGQTPDLRA